MSTATAIRTYEKTSTESHKENVEFALANKLPMVEIHGNTFPIKNVLYAMGGRWNKEKKVQEVPQHRAEEALALAAKFAKPVKAPAAPAAQVQSASPAPVAKAPKVKQEKIAPAHNSEANLILRAETLRQMAAKLESDIGLIAGDDKLLDKARINTMAAGMALTVTIQALKGE